MRIRLIVPSLFIAFGIYFVAQDLARDDVALRSTGGALVLIVLGSISFGLIWREGKRLADGRRPGRD